MIALMLCLGAGVQPIITSSSDDKLETIRKISPRILGINYKTTHDQVAEVKRLTNGRGVDYVLNNTGIPSVIDDIEMLRERDGTVSLVGALGGFESVWKHSELIKLMTKRAKLKCVQSFDFYSQCRYISLTMHSIAGALSWERRQSLGTWCNSLQTKTFL